MLIEAFAGLSAKLASVFCQILYRIFIRLLICAAISLVVLLEAVLKIYNLFNDYIIGHIPQASQKLYVLIILKCISTYMIVPAPRYC